MYVKETFRLFDSLKDLGAPDAAPDTPSAGSKKIHNLNYIKIYEQQMCKIIYHERLIMDDLNVHNDELRQ